MIIDEFGSPIVVTEFAATVKCRDCSDREPLLGHNDDAGVRLLEDTYADRLLKATETSSGSSSPGQLSDIAYVDVALTIEMILTDII